MGAPAHHHTVEEVLTVLAGTAVAVDRPLAPAAPRHVVASAVSEKMCCRRLSVISWRRVFEVMSPPSPLRQAQEKT